jgi:hypothetical protein
MSKTVVSYYKFPFLITIVLIIVLVAVTPIRLPIQATQIVLGAVLGALILDLEYILYAYAMEPQKDFSKTMVGFIKHHDFTNVVNHIRYHKDQVEDKSLNSALFQVVIAVLSIFVVSATDSLFAKSFVISVLASSLYKLSETYFEGHTDEWFWAFKTKPSKSGTRIFFAAITAVLILCIYLA